MIIHRPRSVRLLLALAAVIGASGLRAQYKVTETRKVGGAGGFDYVYADAPGRRLYIPRGDRVTVFNLDTLAPAGVIENTKSVHGATVDPKSGHGFSSSNPVVMWDAKTLQTIRTIDVGGGPDGILDDESAGRVYILSHRSPNVTAINASTGEIVGTLDLEGAPEQAVFDGHGHLYIDIEDKDKVAVIDAVALKVTGTYALQGKGGTPAGLALDARNGILFVGCRSPATCVVLNAKDGSILATLPLGAGTDGMTFNPKTNEAFSSQRDGTLTVIKESSPTSFVVEQNVATQVGAKTCTLDAKTGRILLITAEYGPTPTATPAPADGTARPAGRGPRAPMIPDSFTILAVGR